MKCLLSCKYCKWNHDVAPTRPHSSRGVSNYERVIRLLCQVKNQRAPPCDCCGAASEARPECRAQEMKRAREEENVQLSVLPSVAAGKYVFSVSGRSLSLYEKYPCDVLICLTGH